jgi:hypothetical protein
MVAAGADAEARAAMDRLVDSACAELARMGLDAEHHAFFSGIAQHVVERVS